MLRRWMTTLAGVAIACPQPSLAQGESRAALTGAVRTAVDRGELLYIYDQAAWHGTDDFRTRFPALLSQTGGYVVSGDDLQTELVFYDKSKTKAVYRGTFASGKLTHGGQPAAERVELSALERQLIMAKDKALLAFQAAKVGTCNRAVPNLAALPPKHPGGPIIVYLMTPQTELDAYPLGGHFSVEVRGDGSVSDVRRFTKSCIDMPLNPKIQIGKPAAFAITHLLDPIPTEIHIFTSIASGVPLIVVTSPRGRMWSVVGNRVEMGGELNEK